MVTHLVRDEDFSSQLLTTGIRILYNMRMPSDAAWGEQIKRRREELGLSSEELGARIGRHFSMVHRYENSEIDLRRSVMVKIAEALEADPCDLFFPEWGVAA